MYRKQTWTMRQYAGYASAKESNERYRYLLSKGSTGLSMAFDLPTQLGLDSDNPRCLGEVGRTGVAIDTIDDMRTAFDGIPLDQVSTSMTINAPAACLLLLYELVGEEQGVPSEQLRGTTQNDVLKEYIARGNYIYPPEPTMRITTDLFQYCQENVPKWNTISISGYHFREKGCSAVQEVAFTLSSGIAYVTAAIEKGLDVDDFAPRLAFFFNGHNNVFQEVAKFRAARRMWAHIMRERFGATNPKSTMLRFHTQTGGVTLTAQQPENNIVRVALQGFAAVCGGTQSLHTNGFDEALGAADRARGEDRPAHPADPRVRVGGGRHGGPVRGLLLRGVADRRDRSARQRADRARWTHSGARSTRSSSSPARSTSRRGATRSAIASARTSWWASTSSRRTTSRCPTCCAWIPQSEREQVERLKAFKANRDQAAGREAPGGAARDRARQRQPAARDPPGTEGPLLAGRGVRGDAGRVRQVRAHVLMSHAGTRGACTCEVHARPQPSAHAPMVTGRMRPVTAPHMCGGPPDGACAVRINRIPPVIATVQFFEVVLAVHIMAVVFAFGATFAYPVLLGAVGKADSRSLPALYKAIHAISVRGDHAGARDRGDLRHLPRLQAARVERVLRAVGRRRGGRDRGGRGHVHQPQREAPRARSPSRIWPRPARAR